MTDEVYRVPIVFVMSLVSKPWILDLTFGQSFVQYMLAQGFDVFMIDWGIPRPKTSASSSTTTCWTSCLAASRTCRRRPARTTSRSSATAWAGSSALMYGGVYPDAPHEEPRNCAATPVDMNGMGLFKTLVRPRVVRRRPPRRHARQYSAGVHAPLVRDAPADGPLGELRPPDRQPLGPARSSTGSGSCTSGRTSRSRSRARPTAR